MLGTLRYCNHMKHISHASLAFNNNCLGQVISGLAGRHQYSKDKGSGCCKDIAQTAGRKVEVWPKSDPPPQSWRAECPQDPQPPNYDPYRIKVPEVVVPPLPPSNVKRTGLVYTTSGEHGQAKESGLQHHHHQSPQHAYTPSAQRLRREEENKDSSFLGLLKGFFEKLRGRQRKGDSDAMMNDSREDIQSEEVQELLKSAEFNFHSSSSVQDLFHNSPIVHPDYWKDKPVKKLTEAVKEVLPKLGYHGKNKYKYAFHEPWKPLDRIALLEQAEKQELEQYEVATTVVKTDSTKGL